MSAIVLHPLTLINISDHFMRCKGESVFGALLGQHSGKSISIVTSYALKGHENVDHEFFLAEQEQCTVNF